MTGYLLDSHILVWWKETPETIRAEARHAIASGRSQLYFSHASVWELHIKISSGRLMLPEPLDVVLRDMRCHYLPITPVHLEEVKYLPFLHKDPFDRMLVAQARMENLTLITRDESIQDYDVMTLAA